MSIVAERPVEVQDGLRVGAGLAEEIARQEWADNARGPEAEGSARSDRGRRERVRDERRAALAVAGVSEHRTRSAYVGGDRVDLRTREDVVLTPESAARLGRLVELYDARLRRWARWSLEYKRDADADDIVQNTWLRLSQRMDTLEREDEQLYPLIKSMAKFQMLSEVSTVRQREWSTEDDALLWLAGATEDDTTACAVLDLLDGDQGPGWSACYADAIAALPARQREVLEMRCVDGMTTPAIGARLGITKQSAQYHLRKALDALRPAVGAPVETGLPEGYERMLDRLPASQQQVVRLVVRGGLTDAEIERRTGYAKGGGRAAYNSAVRSLRRMVRDHKATPASLRRTAHDHEPAPRPGPGVCADKCATGCYLRTARTAAAGTVVG